MKTLTTLLLALLVSGGLWADFSAKQEEIIDRHLERIEKKLPLIMDTWNPPNNEPQCVSFEIYEVIEEIPTNQTELRVYCRLKALYRDFFYTYNHM